MKTKSTNVIYQSFYFDDHGVQTREPWIKSGPRSNKTWLSFIDEKNTELRVSITHKYNSNSSITHKGFLEKIEFDSL